MLKFISRPPHFCSLGLASLRPSKSSTKHSTKMRRSAHLTLVFLVLSLHTLGQTSALQTPKPAARNINKEPPSPLQVAGIYAVAPAIPAIVLPILTDTFRATQLPADLLTVLVAKRGFIYILATLATAYAGWRASTSLPAGESLDALNREILRGEAPPTEAETSETQVKEAEQKENKDEAIFAVLDEVDGVNQNIAVALPFVLAAALSISYLLLQGSTPSDPAVVTNNIDVLAMFSKFSTFSNLAICLLFSAAEYRSCTVSDDSNSNSETFPRNLISIPNIIALAAVSAASLLPLSQAWPIQNSVNIALAVTVTRALAPFLMEESGSIRTLALALTGLAAYDVVSVFGTSILSVQAAGALDVGSISNSVTDMVSSASTSASSGIEASSIITAGDNSVMETVARAKLEGPWRPGLLDMVLAGRVSDVLGLGDIVFPACLVSWGFAFNMAYAYAAIAGYVLGSLLTEVVSTFGPTQGLPALIFLAPAMLGSVTLVAIQRGEMELVWGEGEMKTEDRTSD